MLRFLLPESVRHGRSERSRRDLETLLDALSNYPSLGPVERPPLDRCEAVGVTPRSQRFVLSFLDGRERPVHLQSLELDVLQPHFDLYRLSLANITRSSEEAPVRGYEALDLGRRVVHDEAGELLQHALSTSLVLDLEAARRLFTLFFLIQHP